MEDFMNMNCKERKAVEELEIRVKNDLTPAMREDISLFYRFLKAQDFNVDEAEKFLRKNICWRKTLQVDTMLQNFHPNEFFEKYVIASLIGFDKEGNAVAYNALGMFDISEVFKSTKINNLMKHYVWNSEKSYELLREHNKKIGIHRYQGTLIFNFENISFKEVSSKFIINLFLRMINMWQQNYPEQMKYIYAINAPTYILYMFSILKTIMSSRTIKKIRIFGYNGWKESLLEFIDPDVLPAFLGGNRTDPDGNPLCRSFLNPGGKIPEKYFLTDEERYFPCDAQVKTITIPRQGREEIEVNIEEDGFFLKWAFFVQNNDIGFGLSYRKSDNEIEDVLPLYRYETPDGTVEDTYKCPISGTYIIIFDNSFSWLSSKVVQYSISIEITTA